ncbi:MetQ/NlpA family ABC transporter substrate-binding protein [Aerococcus kribbianus]|uniref:MetQ/NlpA family ABC transporter substrate-binding protein n=1 Tax=Aerococcus kribbianus TaxID=2999064 RepID=A0A9X3FM23_9LACT|nr:MULTISPECIES: MetQ/NlpA family ABC transporter substrate-binding protein [unclassified Aerococcus]MCZ0716860.1 MetQ/NlpA family ABC transporter substrate-binding protein [Aerococcus sp. YH-aer221]MCZ0725148.1 MetQ/NlpA family ABC transporter substrate-binding protein [Aerococcus sp. YH-aer222]
MKKLSKKYLVLLIVLLMALSACQKEEKVYKIGVVSDRAEEIWDFALEDLLEEADYDVEIVQFSDYVQPNVALSEGSIDANGYQYYTFLYDYMQSSGDDLYPLGYLSAEPLGIWSTDAIQSKEDIPENAQIAVINDPVNYGNALIMLADVGLLTLKEDAPLVPSENDIESTYKNLEIVPMEAGAIPRALGDVPLILSGATATTEYGLKNSDALYFQDMENSSSNLRLNFVVRDEDKENEDLKEILAAYQRPEVVEFANETGAGDFYPAWNNDDIPSQDMQTYIDYVNSKDKED